VIAFALGIDPGPSSGLALLDLTGGMAPRAFQCNAAAAPWLLQQILADLESLGYAGQARGGIEGFAPGRGAGAAQHGARVSGQVQELAAICAEFGVPLTARYASQVKLWATGKRLRAAGLYELVPGSTHARDSLRHALFTAVNECGWPDPLSRKART
jgi:hypothetical protein